ncbi:Regulatory protein BlaR1 [Pseudobythopirellula maris]|uniref:Regulatory protein BlaR1 n=1 Tax=Pseudobythopirellula maris TaxID=2527991 RepID=A0A5C5ZKA1_9BACT|nr:M56 family metallopeptidase [Pseudobythopirellula maris]TWT87650.1 Regulatory protein BlaR1 [Pseudobythopirellula maris]
MSLFESLLLDSWASALLDFHLAAFALLAFALAAGVVWRQPVWRLALAWGAGAGVCLLLALALAPEWGLWRLTVVQEATPAAAPSATVAPTPDTQDLATQAIDAIAANPLATTPTPSSSPTRQPPNTAHNLPERLIQAAALGGMVAVAWLLIGAFASRRLLADAKRAPPALVGRLAALPNVTPLPRLLVSDRLATAVATGLRRPAIVLPAQWAGDKPAEELDAVLAHELAHLRNKDLWLLAALRLLSIVLWPQPLYWLLRRRVRLDQETLADAAAAELSGRQAYAERLLGWARTLTSPPRLAGAAGLWEGPSQLRSRVAVLLDEKFTVLRSLGVRWRAACGVACLTLAVAASLVTLSPAQNASEAQPSRVAEAPAASDGAPPQDGEVFDVFLPAAPPQHAETARPVLLPGEAGKITGVCKTPDGEPVEGAEVVLSRLDMGPEGAVPSVLATTTAAENGGFEFAGLPDFTKESSTRIEMAFPFSLSFKKPGLASQSAHVEPAMVEHEGVRWLVTMPPAAPVSGRVTDAQGNPLAGATVRFVVMPGLNVPGPLHTAVTDAEGRYVIDDLAAADFEAMRQRELRQQRESLERQQKAAEEEGQQWTGSFLAATQRCVEATRAGYAVTWAPLDRAPSEVDLVMRPEAVVTGQVLGPDGEPVVDQVVVLRGDGLVGPASDDEAGRTAAELRQVYLQQATDGEGRYRFAGLPAGGYVVSLLHTGAEDPLVEPIPSGEQRVTSLEAGSTAEPPPLQLETGRIVTIQLIDEASSEPIVLEKESTASLGVQLVNAKGSLHYFAAPVTAQGRLRLRLPASELVIRLHSLRAKDDYYDATDWRPVESVSLGAGAAEVRYPINPDGVSVASYVRQAGKLASNKSIDEAIALLTEQLAKRPDNTRLRMARAEIANGWGREAEAIADYERVLVVAPDHWVAKNNLAYLLATAKEESLRDAERAVVLARRAVESLPSPYYAAYETLATAQAANGEYDTASATWEQAISLAPERFRAELREKLAAAEALRDEE